MKKKIKYCDNCGYDLKDLNHMEIEKRICPSCNKKIYDPIIIGSGGLIEVDNKILLIIRTHEPFKNMYNLPSGHVKFNEGPEEAAIREVYEETGLKVEIDYLFGNYFFDDHPDGYGINIVYKCNIIGGELTDTKEGKEAKYFNSQSLPTNIAGGGHDKAISDWKARNIKQTSKLEHQLSNAINSRSSEDQVMWSIFGGFSAFNAILLVALFPNGKLPEQTLVGMVICILGILISATWKIMQVRALSHIKYLEKIIYLIEKSLNYKNSFAISSEINTKLKLKFLTKRPKARQTIPLIAWSMIFFWTIGLISFILIALKVLLI